jgi:hypothetical protein
VVDGAVRLEVSSLISHMTSRKDSMKNHPTWLSPSVQNFVRLADELCQRAESFTEIELTNLRLAARQVSFRASGELERREGKL